MRRMPTKRKTSFFLTGKPARREGGCAHADPPRGQGALVPGYGVLVGGHVDDLEHQLHARAVDALFFFIKKKSKQKKHNRQIQKKKRRCFLSIKKTKHKQNKQNRTKPAKHTKHKNTKHKKKPSVTAKLS